MPTVGTKSKGAGTQQTLLGFFGKTSTSSSVSQPVPRSTTSSVNGAGPTKQTPASSSSSSMSPVADRLNDDSSLTPPPTVRKEPSITSTAHTRQHPSAVSPSEARGGTARAKSHVDSSKHSKDRYATELTPPSSSPVMDMDDEEDEDDRISRLPRRRAATKRRIKYVESDEEGSSPTAAMNIDDDDDDDRFSPDRETPAKSKKGRYSRGGASSDDDDDEFDDFIVPDDEMLGALDDAENSAHSRKKAAKVKLAAPSPVTSKPSAASLTPWSSTPRPPISKGAGSSKQKSPSEEQPYEFLLNSLDENGNPPNHPDYDPRTLFIPDKTMKTLTPFEKQYWEIKRKHNDTVLFFQKGKFYELYEDDAVTAHREFGLKLTDRVKMKMAGVPESSYTMFANKFLALGYKVGRVDQTETAVGQAMRKSAAGPKPRGAASSVASSSDDCKIVRRDLRSIMTTGTIVDADCLPDDMSSYCISIKEVVNDDNMDSPSGGGLTGGNDEESMRATITFGICILEAGVAQFNLHYFEDDVTRTKLETLLRSLRIKEVLYEKGRLSKRSLRVIRNSVDANCTITMLKSGTEFLSEGDTMRKLNLVLNPNLAEEDAEDLEAVEPVDVALLPPAIAESLDKPEAMSALGAMLSYLTQLNLEKDLCASRHFDIFETLSRNECMILDAQSLTHLNVLLNEQGDTQGTLLQLVNRSVTPFGKRLMKVWLLSPLSTIESIQQRQDAVEAFLRDSTLPDEFDRFARSLPDMERIMPRIYAGNCKSKDFAKVLKALGRIDDHVAEWTSLANEYSTDVVSRLLSTIPSVSEQAKAIHSRYQDETFEPRPGGDEPYDDADRQVRDVEKALHIELHKAAQQVKLPKDKVKFKDVGTNEIYQIEVPIKTNVPMDWALTSQTQSVKRYYSPQIRALVKQLKEARETRVAALKIFQSRLFQQFQQHGDTFLQAVKGLAELDCLFSLAKASQAMDEPTCRPDFVDSETAFVDFIELRHPCLANAATTVEFISNDIQLGGSEEDDATVTILTGGNMAGKSTTARTTATGVILAQLGCRVPACGARLSPIDRIATRMGANDQLFRNNSTFMVEMLEASRILKDCTPRSLVIMDELGRGTSTFDGQAIAFAVLHYLIGQSRSLCFFLTHYTQLARDFDGHLGVKNKHMQVIVDGDTKTVIFTYKLINGIAESSYGTEVAALAGIPLEVCSRAHTISQSFLKSTMEVEAQRKHNVQSKIDTATVSDFVHLFRHATGQGEEKDCAGIPSKTVTFMRKQVQHLFAHLDKDDSSSIVLSDTTHTEAATYARRRKRPLQALRDFDDCTSTANSSASSGLGRSESKNTAKKYSSTNGGEQMVLDLGQTIHITCKQCGMSYDRSDKGDCAMHEKHHTRLTKGLEWTNKQVRRQARILREMNVHLPSTIGVKGSTISVPVEVLVYNRGSAGLDSATISSLDEVQEDMDKALGATEIPPSLHRSTKVYLVIGKGRVMASLIAGPTPQGKARRVLSSDIDRVSAQKFGTGNLSGDEAVFVPNEYIPAKKTPPLAIYRIHVLSAARRCGLASALLDAALDDCVYGMSAASLVELYQGKANTTAFSQPTTEGRHLAERWIRKGSAGGERWDDATSLLVFDEESA